MNPIQFPEQNTMVAKDQPEYLDLPAYWSPASDGEVISCWRLTFWERIRVLLTGRLWLRQLTFHERLQPQLPQIERPFGEKKE